MHLLFFFALLLHLNVFVFFLLFCSTFAFQTTNSSFLSLWDKQLSVFCFLISQASPWEIRNGSFKFSLNTRYFCSCDCFCLCKDFRNSSIHYTRPPVSQCNSEFSKWYSCFLSKKVRFQKFLNTHFSWDWFLCISYYRILLETHVY